MKNKLSHILDAIKELGGEVRELIFSEPAFESDVEGIEKRLGQTIPENFRNILLTVSANCEIYWFLPDEFDLPETLAEIFSGDLHWGTKYLEDYNERKNHLVKEVFPNPSDEYDKIWHNKFVFQEVGNGDYLAIDLERENYGKIIYLSHDDGEGHGYVMANSFSELLEVWIEIACVGAEDWQWLAFTKDKESGIIPNCDNAVIWKDLIKLN